MAQTDRPFDIFVYSHTHRAQYFPLEKVNDYWKPQVVNTGAWQRVISPEQLEKQKRKENLADKDVLREFVPEKLPACYSTVLVEPYTGRPTAQLQYWRRIQHAQWGLAETCD